MIFFYQDEEIMDLLHTKINIDCKNEHGSFSVSFSPSLNLISHFLLYVLWLMDNHTLIMQSYIKTDT